MERTEEQHPSVSTASGSNSRDSSIVRRGNGHGRLRNPLNLNSGLWISAEFVIKVSQIVASIIVLCLSREEDPRVPLREWIVGYASGCVATLPLLYWRFQHLNQTSAQGSSVTRTTENEGQQTSASSGSVQGRDILNARVQVLMEYLKKATLCFFAVWFIFGNIWIFAGHSSSSEAPSLYRLFMVFLAFCCIGYAMPFIPSGTISYCLPRIISGFGFREELTQNRGATPESINSLPTYKFKIKKNRLGSDRETNSDEGIVAAGTEKERVVSGEDTVCCICLSKYANNDELRELLCSHFFHKECIDNWLKINALCPLCKGEV